ncbi:C40 family peptidase [Nocardiopsis sp. NPDC006198]|uniref:C40 family peptidase n=1 Tax=Nocardiopsis sp. NPDC006198 TaxID=3154472 RepID=UPI0033BB687B
MTGASGGAAGVLWDRARAFLLPRRGRGGDRGSATARVGGGVTALAVMGGIAYAATVCGPAGGAAPSSADGAGSSGGVVQASANTSSETISISAHGEPGSSQKSVRVDIPDNVLRAHRMAAEAYGLPWELMAAIGAIETQNGQYVSTDPNWHSGLREGERNPYGAAGIVQFGVQDLRTGQVGGRLGSAGNSWGGKPKEPVEDRRFHYEVGEMPGNPTYFGIDGNDDGMVNVWDPWDNIASGAFRIAYYADQAEKRGSGSVCGSGRADLTPIECTVYKHNPARWYVAQVLEVAEYYSGSGLAPTSPSLELQQASSTPGQGRDCEEQGGNASRAAFLGDVGEEHRTAVEFARQQIGKPYVWGARGPDSYDCSGLTQAAWRAAGVTIPWVTTTQWDPGNAEYRGGTARRVLEGDLDISVLQPGDLLLFHTSPRYASPSHVGIYSGGGRMIHAANPSKPIEEVSIDSGYYRSSFVGAVRISPDSSGGEDSFAA